MTSFRSISKSASICLNHNCSPSKTEWQRPKNIENANNPAIDDIMDTTGLKAAKQQVLQIKSKVETPIRQGTDLKKESLGVVLLGNPGTGRSFTRCFGDIADGSRQNNCCKALRKSLDVFARTFRGRICRNHQLSACSRWRRGGQKTP